jgi:hypothetical protein
VRLGVIAGSRFRNEKLPGNLEKPEVTQVIADLSCPASAVFSLCHMLNGTDFSTT